jgi:hypothetical protein
MLEGYGSGLIPRTNGSGSGSRTPKNIRNTALCRLTVDISLIIQLLYLENKINKGTFPPGLLDRTGAAVLFRQIHVELVEARLAEHLPAFTTETEQQQQS